MTTPPRRPSLASVALVSLTLALAIAPAGAQVFALPRWTPQADLPRSVLAAAYDRARDRVVAFGTRLLQYDDPVRAVEWNGSWQEHQLAAPSTVVVPLGAVYDSTRLELLLVGYTNAVSTSGAATEIYRSGRFERGPVVPFLRGAALVHDPIRGETLAFGGSGGGFTVVDAMWRWDGTAWSAVVQPSVRPAARKDAAMAFDPVRGVVVFFGGSDGVSNPFGDTWTWDGQSWTPVAATGPLPRDRAGFAFDHVAGGCLLHGGYVREQEVPGTWLWNGSAWLPQNAPPAPGAGLLTETATRPLLIRERAMGGNGTWRWNGSAFDRLAAPQNALARFETAMAYDRARGELVLFGGQPIAGGLWLWNGAWRELGLLPNGPVARRNHAMVYDAARQRVVLFGGRDADVAGNTLGDTWTWDGTSWTQQQPTTAPSPRWGPGLVFDAARGECLLFGGHTFQSLGDTWTWNGTDWTRQQPATSPPARLEPGIADDEARQRVVLLNGRLTSGSVLDTWEWDGATWTQRFPQVQAIGPIVYDRGLQRVTVITGFGAVHAWDGAEWRPVPVYAPSGARPSPIALGWHDGLGRVVVCASGEGPVLWSLTTGAADLRSSGTPCPSATTNDCDLLALGRPRLGNGSFALDLRGSVGQSYGAMVFGTGEANVQLPGGCSLLVGSTFGGEIVWLGAGGYGRVRLPIPADPRFAGAVVVVQGFAIDGSGPIGGASASKALRLQIGY